jgi:hypothetical protein
MTLGVAGRPCWPAATVPVFRHGELHRGDRGQRPIGNAGGLSELTMESAGGTAMAGPSALTGGSAFSVTSDSGPNGPVTGTGGGTGGGAGGTGGAGTGRHRHHHHSAGF